MVYIYEFILPGIVFIKRFREGIPSPFIFGNQPFPNGFYTVGLMECLILLLSEIRGEQLTFRDGRGTGRITSPQLVFPVLEYHFTIFVRSVKDRLVKNIPVIIRYRCRFYKIPVMGGSINIAY